MVVLVLGGFYLLRKPFGGKKGCGSKPIASRLSRFSALLVGYPVIRLLSLSDFGRRPACFRSLLDFGRRLLSRNTLFSVSFVTIMLLSLSDFGAPRHLS